MACLEQTWNRRMSKDDVKRWQVSCGQQRWCVTVDATVSYIMSQCDRFSCALRSLTRRSLVALSCAWRAAIVIVPGANSLLRKVSSNHLAPNNSEQEGSKILARDVKLIPHRWDMHAIQALGNRDHELLARIFTELQIAEGGVNSRVKIFGFGAAAQFHSYGFFDKRSSPPGCSTASLDYVVEDDTLLLISLRNCDPLSAKVLVEAGASLTDANIVGEVPIQQLFNAYATIKLVEKERLQSTDPSASSHDVTRAEGNKILNQQLDFQALFVLTQKQIDSFYDTLKAKIRLELEQIYEKYAPERIAKLQKQLDDFEFNEQLLLESVRRKYLSSS